MTWSVHDLRHLPGGGVHVVPDDDLMEHSAPECSCGMYEEDDCRVLIFVHKAKDGRVAYERGERKAD